MVDLKNVPYAQLSQGLIGLMQYSNRTLLRNNPIRKEKAVNDIAQKDYSIFDQPEILAVLFHPRPEEETSISNDSQKDFLIPVENEVNIGAGFHLADASAPNILFFHGNGEIVADYDDMGQLYIDTGFNFLAVDYRGYGRSTGSPTVASMMKDCHMILDWVRNRLSRHGHSGPLIVMGRSLGSASALELAANCPEKIDGLIIESGFSYVTPLLELLGIRTKQMGINEKEGSRNIDKIRNFTKPTLIIHGEHDQIIPFHEGEALYKTSPAEEKKLLKISGADHNTLFYYGMKEYLGAVRDLNHRINIPS